MGLISTMSLGPGWRPAPPRSASLEPVEVLERVDVAGGRPRNAVEYEHWARYRWALQFARGEILDIACGTGHGSALLSEGGKVTGVDRDREALAIAQSRVRGGRFVTAECPPIPLPDKAFDTVVSFETLEHVAEDEAFVAEIRRVLRSGGALLLSTPNSRVRPPRVRCATPGMFANTRWMTCGPSSNLISARSTSSPSVICRRRGKGASVGQHGGCKTSHCGSGLVRTRYLEGGAEGLEVSRPGRGSLSIGSWLCRSSVEPSGGRAGGATQRPPWCGRRQATAWARS